MTPLTKEDLEFLRIAYKEAKKGYEEGGVPVGAAMSLDGKLLSQGHNKRVQENNPIAHGEMDCIQKAGRKANYKGVTLYTTLSPCMMCSGTIVQFGIKRVVIGENKNFDGNIKFLRDNGVEVYLVGDKECEDLMSKFIKEKPELWNEDIAQD
jgi:cytosine deaminase